MQRSACLPRSLCGVGVSKHYALRVLRAHGLCDSALKTVYRAVVVAKLT